MVESSTRAPAQRGARRRSWQARQGSRRRWRAGARSVTRSCSTTLNNVQRRCTQVENGRSSSPPPAPPSCDGAVFSIVQRFKSRAGYAAEVYVPQWHLHHTITLDFGVPTEVYAIWSAELAGVTPTTATFRLGAYGTKFRLHAQGQPPDGCCIPCGDRRCSRPPPPPPRIRSPETSSRGTGVWG